MPSSALLPDVYNLVRGNSIISTHKDIQIFKPSIFKNVSAEEQLNQKSWPQGCSFSTKRSECVRTNYCSRISTVLALLTIHLHLHRPNVARLYYLFFTG